jgi:ABC-type dipeptide/oligopeptide/nickel transport system permease subunit
VAVGGGVRRVYGANQDTLLHEQRTKFARYWATWSGKPIGLASLVFVVLLIVVSIIGPVLQTHDPLTNNLREVLVGPSTEHLFGTDPNGRDVYSRLVGGARISIFIGFASVFFGVSAGVLIGTISGFLGGFADYAIQRVVDAVMAIPGLILLLAVVSVLEPSLTNLVIALCIYVTPRTVRIVRGEVMVARHFDYVEAARALGGTTTRVMFRHVLPNVMAPILIIGSITVGQAILIEASLGFLGFGVPPPEPTWGNMLSGANRQYMQSAPWLVLAPGIAITLTVLAFNMLGDALRDILDPRLRGSR